MHRLLTSVALAVAVSARVNAQALQRQGFSALPSTAPRADSGTPEHHRWPTPAFADSSAPKAWKWIAVGALGGAVVGGTIAALHVARTDDAFFPTVAVGTGVVIGGVGGSLLGALAYAVGHIKPGVLSARCVSPNVRWSRPERYGGSACGAASYLMPLHLSFRR